MKKIKQNSPEPQLRDFRRRIYICLENPKNPAHQSDFAEIVLFTFVDYLGEESGNFTALNELNEGEELRIESSQLSEMQHDGSLIELATMSVRRENSDQFVETATSAIEQNLMEIETEYQEPLSGSDLPKLSLRDSPGLDIHDLVDNLLRPLHRSHIHDPDLSPATEMSDRGYPESQDSSGGEFETLVPRPALDQRPARGHRSTTTPLGLWLESIQHQLPPQGEENQPVAQEEDERINGLVSPDVTMETA